MSSRRNPTRSSSSHPIPPRSSCHLSSLAPSLPPTALPSPPPTAPLMTSFPLSPAASGPSLGPGSPTSVDLNELEAAVISSCSIPKLVLDPPALTLEPPTSPESGDRHQRVPTSPPQSMAAASSPHPATKCQRGASSPASKKGKGKEKDKAIVSLSSLATAPPQKTWHLLPNMWASLLSASSSLASLVSSSPSAPTLSSSSTASSSASCSLLAHPMLLPPFPSASSPIPPSPAALAHPALTPALSPAITLPASAPQQS